MEEKVQGISIICRYKRDRAGKNSIGNEEVKELVCMTHGHELRRGNAGRREDAGQMGIKGEKTWDNCNSVIKKIYLKK